MPPPIPESEKAEVRRLAAELDARGRRLWTSGEIAAKVGRAKSSVQEIIRGKPVGGGSPPAPVAAGPGPARMPAPDSVAGGPRLPDPEPMDYSPVHIDTSGVWGVISDVHIPYHDRRTVESAVREWKARGVAGVLLNGDILDFYQVSKYSRDPSKPRVKAEIEKGRQFLDYLRAEFPRARVVYKLGNHDERLGNYLSDRAPEVFDLDDMQFDRLLRMADYGVEMVADKRVVMLGKLPVIHGHEYRGGGGVMPSRWLFIRAFSNAMLGHFHQPTNFTVRTLDDRELGVWSTGCACFLHPSFAPQNQWAHGWATVEVFGGGSFQVENRRLLKDGRVA
jgi:predicted phosphodiesterase